MSQFSYNVFENSCFGLSGTAVVLKGALQELGVHELSELFGTSQVVDIYLSTAASELYYT